MAAGFSLSNEDKLAFDELISNKKDFSSAAGGGGAFDVFNALVGQEKILTEIKSKLQFGFLGQALFVCDSQNNKGALVALAKFCALSGFTPVLVLFGSNYKTISSVLKEGGFSGDFIIIDCVSKGISNVEESDGVFFVDSLRNLTQVQIKVINLIKSRKRFAFVFDSLLVLRFYHQEDVVLKFINSFTRLLRKNESPAFYIATDKNDSQKLGQFFDEVIELKKFF